jgi:hypothetical protein
MLGEATLDTLGTFLGEAIRHSSRLPRYTQAAEDLSDDRIVIYDHVLGAIHAGREPRLTGP